MKYLHTFTLILASWLLVCFAAYTPSASLAQVLSAIATTGFCLIPVAILVEHIYAIHQQQARHRPAIRQSTVRR